MIWAKTAVVVAALAAPPSLAETPAPQAPAYEPDLLRLSEILGSVQFLRELCGTNEGTLWRDQMQGLIDSTEPDTLERARIMDRYNRGYDSFRSVYRVCTGAARVAVDRYLDEGAKIAAEIAARFGK
jgi:uncharacterized protein (TIGR02301 family)